MPPFSHIKKLEAVGDKVKVLTFHSVTASAAGWSVAMKSMCLTPVGLVLVMELTKKPSKGTGGIFWQLVGRQEPWDLLQMEPGPAAAAVGGRRWGDCC